MGPMWASLYVKQMGTKWFSGGSHMGLPLEHHLVSRLVLDGPKWGSRDLKARQIHIGHI